LTLRDTVTTFKANKASTANGSFATNELEYASETQNFRHTVLAGKNRNALFRDARLMRNSTSIYQHLTTSGPTIFLPDDHVFR
jgi:hypothetical protein